MARPPGLRTQQACTAGNRCERTQKIAVAGAESRGNILVRGDQRDDLVPQTDATPARSQVGQAEMCLTVRSGPRPSLAVPPNHKVGLADFAFQPRQRDNKAPWQAEPW